jgi:signal transduction histidine kinase
MSIYEDYAGNIWLATIQGLNRYVPGKDYFEKFTNLTYLEKGFLYHIMGDKNDVLWITCTNGLVRFDQKADSNHRSKLFEFENNGLFENIYPYSFFINKRGEIYIGGKYGVNNGYYKFNSVNLQINKNIPTLVLTNFLVKNEKFNTDITISAKKRLLLKHDQNFFSFEFAALDYTDPEKNQYAYYLEGFENDWNYSGNRNYANYTGVPPGKYTFHVKGSNNDGYWNETGVSIALTILPPNWRTWWAYALYGLSFLIILFSLFYIYLRRQQLLHDVEQLKREKKLMAARSLIEGQEEERKRIAEELHDGLGVLLSAAKIQVSSINLVSEEEKPLIEKAGKLLERASKDVRKISHNMMPGLLTNFGLFEALRDLVENVNDAKQIAASINIIGTEKRLPDNKEIMLYRIIQELINNTLKHAGAKTITIEVLIQPDQLEITYKDDGKGFDIRTTRSLKSIGLQSIHSRIDFLGGKLTFESEKDKGAKFYMKVPL